MSGQFQVAVDPERCIGSGICAGLAPDRFRLVDGYSQPIAELIGADPGDAALDAADSCPVEAITVRDAATAELRAPRP